MNRSTHVGRVVTSAGCAAALLLAGIFVPAAMAGTRSESCTRDGATLVVEIEGSGDPQDLNIWSLLRDDDNIELKPGNDPPIDCGNATVNNIDRMTVSGSPEDEVFIFGMFDGGFRPGATPEEGEPEIEFEISLGDGEDSVEIVGPKHNEAPAEVYFGAAGTNINGDGDGDDVVFDEDVERMRFDSAPGHTRDFVTGMGRKGTGGPIDRPLELYGRESPNTLIGGLADDIIVGGGDNDVLRGGPGDDRLGAKERLVSPEDGRDVMHGGPGDDILLGDSGDDRLFGGSGKDRIEGNWDQDELHGGSGDDELEGNDKRDVIYGGAGEDLLAGGAKPDFLDGGTGDDIEEGGGGEDLFFQDMTPNGADTLLGGKGRDAVSYEKRDARVEVTPGTTPDDGEDGESDAVQADVEDVIGGAGNDLLQAVGELANRLVGGLGQDELRAGGGNDRLIGGKHGDVLFGETGDDVLRGGEGTDSCSGGPGDDTVTACEK
jgi:Ca2+-binding RTX toxin-like protein